MAATSLFRFVQASCLELDRYCSAAGELTQDQSRLLVDAPFRAAERVFETTLQVGAELLLLTGGALVGRNPSTWGASFLARQSERVGRRGVQVVWLDTGDERRRGWPKFLPQPQNLHICDASLPAPLRLRLPSKHLVELQSAGEPAGVLRRFNTSTSAAPPFRIGLLPAAPKSDDVLDRPVDYWAIYGGDRATTFPTRHGMARSAGSVQPRHSDTISTGGCLIVDVGPGYALGTQFQETNSLRYHVERIELDDSTHWEGFRRRLQARTEEVLQASLADAVLFQWQVQGHGPVIERLTKPRETAALEDELRQSFGTRAPAAWIGPTVLQPDAVQETRWQRDGSTWGTFVRSLDGLPTGDGETVDLARLANLKAIDPAVTHVPRPHYQTSLKSGARRQAAQLLADLSRG
ncbi:MAG: hypothetical protein ACK5Q5_14800 [Planctomycetaceae bacterium]